MSDDTQVDTAETPPPNLVEVTATKSGGSTVTVVFEMPGADHAWWRDARPGDPVAGVLVAVVERNVRQRKERPPAVGPIETPRRRSRR